jgi:uncharacterized damage-inducible protein DinB
VAEETFMRRKTFYLTVTAAFTLAFNNAVCAQQDKPAEKIAGTNSASAPPASGARAEFLEEVAFYEQRYTHLAEAIPAEKYSWRPGEGVRSIGEVFAHIVTANYGIPRAFGAAAPPGFDPKAIQAVATEKAKIAQLLKDSFAHFRQAILTISDADMDKPQKMFGRQTTVRGAFMMITGHFGEHLGQSIAYARVNGITPPWTEEAQRQQQKPAEKPKP